MIVQRMVRSLTSLTRSPRLISTRRLTHKRRCFYLAYGYTDTPPPDFLPLRCTLAVNAPRRKRSGASCPIEPGLSAPNLGVQIVTRGRSQHLPGFAHALSGRFVFSRRYCSAVLISACSHTVSDSSFPLLFSALLAYLFDVYLTSPLSATVSGTA